VYDCGQVGGALGKRDAAVERGVIAGEFDDSDARVGSRHVMDDGEAPAGRSADLAKI
jgi:hypothetical protein